VSRASSTLFLLLGLSSTAAALGGLVPLALVDGDFTRTSGDSSPAPLPVTLQPGQTVTISAALVPWACPPGWTCTPTPPAPAIVRTIGFGPSGLPSLADPAPYTAAQLASSAPTIIKDIATARAQGVKLILALTGGGHANYMSVIKGVFQFDRAKWTAKLRTYDTPQIRAAIAQCVGDGTCVAANVMDEPHVAGAGDGAGGKDGNTWGPKGTMTKARVDSLCGEMHTLFPTLPAGPAHQWQVFQPERSYRVCDLIISQYSARNERTYGTVEAWRDSALAMGARDGHRVMFSMNVLNGGTQDQDVVKKLQGAVWDCRNEGGVRGQASPNCAPTPDQVERWGLALGPSSCGAMVMWRYDSASHKRLRATFQAVADSLGKLPAGSCRREPGPMVAVLPR
jgi:hypothetical protein